MAEQIGNRPSAAKGELSSWVDPSSTAKLKISVDKNGEYTITVSGTPELNQGPNDWNRWKAQAVYGFPMEVGKSYKYEFYAKTEEGQRELTVQYYSNNVTEEYLQDYAIIDDNGSYPGGYHYFVIYGEEIPADAGGEYGALAFHCADVIGTFYVKDVFISEYTPGVQYTLNGAGTEYTVDGFQNTHLNTIPANIALENTHGNPALPVTAIADNAFSSNSYITSVSIPANVKTIGQNAFYNCSNLSSVTVATGSQLVSVGYGAFYSSGLSFISFIGGAPTTLTTIGDWAFAYTNLTDGTIPGSVTTIGESAFMSTNITSVTIPASVTSIGYNAFLGNSSLTSALTEISNGLFYNTSITSINIPSGVTSIGENAFTACSSLTSVTLPASLTSIGNSAFAWCSNIDEITIPSAVTSMGENVFDGWTNAQTIYYYTGANSATWAAVTGWNGNAVAVPFTAFNAADYTPNATPATSYTISGYTGTDTIVIIPSQYNGLPVTAIDANAFTASPAITSVVIPASVTVIGANAFAAATSLTSITLPGNVTVGPTTPFPSSVTSVTFTGTTIGNAFANNANITTVNIPASVTSISPTAFSGCTGITSFAVASGNQYYTGTGATLYNKTQTEIVAWPGATGSITIIASVTSIGSGAFQGNTAITSVTFAAGSQLESIGASAFANTTFTTIAIPASVTTIGFAAFQDSSLTTITFAVGSQLQAINEYVFKDTGLTAITIPASVSNIIGNAFAGTSVVITVEAGSTYFEADSGALYKIGKTALVAYPSATGSITIPATVKSIEERAFEGNIALTGVTFAPSSVLETIARGVFFNCTGLTGPIVIPASVTSIGYEAFAGCINLADVSFAAGSVLQDIAKGAFKSTAITDITIPASVTSISVTTFGGNSSNGAFDGCTDLTEVTCLATTPPTLGTDAFTGCTSLTDIKVPTASVSAYEAADNWKDLPATVTIGSI